MLMKFLVHIEARQPDLMPCAVTSLFEGLQRSQIRPKTDYESKVGRLPNPVKKEYRA